MSDKSRVLEHLRSHGTITPLEAFTGFGCYRLGARIWDLRHDGYDITTEMVEGTDQHGEPMRYAKYHFKEEKQ